MTPMVALSKRSKLALISRSVSTIENHNIRGMLIMLSRRQFMNQSAGIFALGSTASGLWRQAARAAEARRDAPILVVLELSGGNDGLNTVIPHADDVYHKSRPALRVEPGKVLKLDDHVGLHPSLKDLHRLWEAGNLAVVRGVGYPDPNRSHFRSMEIWQTGTVGPAPPAGWLGRFGDAHPRLELCHVGQGSMPLAVQGRKVAAHFRDVYASLIRRWLDVDPTPILGERKIALPLV
jgi:uncharacterized protein (DUF1501 family)